MGPMETVCKYCGVSYLILHEFQRLQERLCAAERELVQFQGSAEREKALQDQLEELTSLQHEQADRLQVLGQQLESVSVERRCLQRQLEPVRESCRRLRTRTELQKKALEAALSLLSSSRREMRDASRSFLQLHSFWKDWSSQLLQSCRGTQAEFERQSRAVDRGRAEMSRLRGQLVELQTRLQAQAAQQKQTWEGCAQLDELQEELSSLRLDLQHSRSERHRLEELLQLSRDLKEKEESWLSCQQRCRSLQEELRMRGRRVDELEEQQVQVEADNRALRNTLQQTQKEITSLKRQSEDAAVGHQELVENLEKTLKLRLAEGESLRAQMETRLEQDRARLALKSRRREDELRRELALELHIERDKSQMMLLELQKQLPSLVEEAKQELQEQVKILQEKLRGAEATLAEAEQHRREEEQEESARRTNLERELLHVRHEEQQGALELAEVKQELQEQRRGMTVLKEEIVLLQETVRRECEEREELTAALSLTRERLLELQQAASSLSSGTLPSGPRMPPTSSRKSTSVSGAHHRITLPMDRKEWD